MADRENVIYSIERCICHVPDACRDCAYDAGHPYNECVELMLKDTISLLKAQEPRLMTLEEVKKMSNNSDVWIEKEYYIGKLSVFAGTINTHGYNALLFYGTRAAYEFESYGKTWRCWTSRPTDEQREAVKWDATD